MRHRRFAVLERLNHFHVPFDLLWVHRQQIAARKQIEVRENAIAYPAGRKRIEQPLLVRFVHYLRRFFLFFNELIRAQIQPPQ